MHVVTDNRAELMDRALELFAAYGYDGVGVQDICEAAAVTKPTLYHYFRSKRGLLETLLSEGIAELLSKLTDLARSEDEASELLKRAASLMIAHARKNPSFYMLYLALWFAPGKSDGREVASRFHVAHFEAMEAVCAVATQQEASLKGRNRAFTAGFLGALNNAINLALNNYSVLNERVAHELTDQFLYGAMPRPPVAARRRRR
jgi:TetR/AcrR family transcriptional regulator